jgi:serine/threonine protein kinase/tetratricopeptide (TPR) repeat protein
VAVPPPTLDTIFLAAIEIAAAEERAAYIAQGCGADAELRGRVEKLVLAHFRAGSFLEKPATPPAPSGGPVDSPLAGGAASEAAAEPGGPEQRGVVLAGRYKLLEKIGEGGMGTVWMAQQTEPVKRLVAVKLIKAGMDSRQVLARFEAERQALALMDHTHIARVLDGGTTSAGRPYFVMDLVKGVPITRYCDEHHLTPRQRLELFIPVCQAVQHAHQKGIIHRDLKPSNVLVALYDGKPVPKVIDFGVAKATGQTLTDKTLVTSFGAIVGTLEYMSPEQAEINQLDIDTRSDIYSLGVLLYELLTGSPPFTRKELEKAGMLEMLRVIREQEPSKPSTKLSTAEGLPTLAANRGTEPALLTKLVRGELDWIVMKALEKDRSRRYETANGLSRDIQRYLNDEVVEASPPSVWYRVRKAVRRHRRLLRASGVLGLAVMVMVGSLGWAVGDRMERRAAADRAATVALGEAHDALAAGRRAAARTALDRANGNLVGGGEGHLAVRAEGLRRELALLDRLDAVRVRSLGRSADNVLIFDYAKSDAAFAEAFRDAGLDLDGIDTVTAVDRCAGRAGLMELAGALDDWAAVRREQKNEASAKHLLAVARQIDPDPWRNRVRDAVDQGDVAALKALAGSAELADQSAGAVHCLAKALINALAFPEAAAILTAAQPRHAGDFWVNYTLGHALGRYRSGRDATPYFMAAAALRPNDDAAALRVAWFLGLQKDPATHAWWDQVARHHPMSASMHCFRGKSLFEIGDRAAAIDAWKEALRLQPDDQESRSLLAYALAWSGPYEEAVQTLDEYARQIPPGATYEKTALNTATLQLSRIADRLTNGTDPSTRNPRVAVRAAARAVELAPQAGYYHVLLGMAQYRAGEYAAAVEVLSRPIVGVHRPIEKAFYFAMARAKLGESAEARKAFATAVLLAERDRAGDEKVRRLAAEAAEVVGATLPPSLRDGPESPVSAPTPVAPGNWTLLDRARIDREQGTWRTTLTWEPVETATRYHLQVRVGMFTLGEVSLAKPVIPPGEPVVDNSLVRTPRWEYASRLRFPRPGEFFPLVCRWRVRALVGDAWTAWSPEQTLWVVPPAIGEPTLKD